MNTTSALEVRGLVVSYGGHVALDGLDLEVQPGERIGVVGPNGAGKSTLLAAALGLCRPDRGQVLLFGQPLGRDRRGIAYLPQRSGADLDHPIRVRELVALGRYPHRGPVGRLRAEDRDAIEEAIDRVGLRGQQTRRLSALSGGQQQRAYLARVLAQRAQVLLLDEPHAGIDAVTSSLLDTCLTEVAQAGAAVVVVNHDLTGLTQRYDRVLVLNRTAVTLCGPQDPLLAKHLRSAYGVPFPTQDGLRVVADHHREDAV